MTSTVVTWLREKPVTGKLIRQFKRTRQARWAMVSQIVTSGANFATTVLLVRALGLEDFGRFSICFLLTMIVRNFLNGMVLMPMSTIASKLNPSSTPAYRGFLAVNAGIFAVLSSLFLIAFCAPLGWLINAPWLVGLVLPLAFANLTAVAADYMRRVHFVYDKPVAACGVDIVRFTFQLACLLALIIIWSEDMTPATALYTLVAGAVAGAAFGAFYHGSARWSSRLARAVWPRHWNFIKWMTPGYALEALQVNSPFLLGAAFIGEGAIGLARALQQVANMLNLPYQALIQIGPIIGTKAFKNRGIFGFKKLLFVVSISVLIFTIASNVFCIILFEYFELLLNIYSKDAFLIYIIYSLVNISFSVRLPLIIWFHVLEKPNVIMSANFVGATVATLTPLFFSQIGTYVIPLSSLLAIVITNGFYYYFYTKEKSVGKMKK